MSYAEQCNPHGDNRHGELTTSTSAPFASHRRTSARTSTEMYNGSQVTARGARPTTGRSRAEPTGNVPGLEHTARHERPAALGARSRLAAPHHRRTVRRIERDARRMNWSGHAGHLLPHSRLSTIVGI